jgi:hypothetical protein
MPLPQLRSIQTADRILTLIQDSVQGWIRQLQRLAPIVDGQLVTGVLIATTDTVVRTGLDRKALGFIIVNANAGASVFLSPTANQVPNNTLILRASAQVTVDLWVF